MKKLAICQQKGMTTLMISIVLLFGISFIALFSTKSIVLEKKMSANSYRSEQAFFRAEAALNFISTRLDSAYPNAEMIRKDQKLDSLSVQEFNSKLESLAQLLNLFINASYDNTQVEAYSDDKSTTRLLTQLQAAVPIAGNGTGKIVTYPLISRLGQDLSENMFISNKHSSHTIWSGGKVQLGLSAKTYIPLSTSETQSANLMLASGEGKNNGADIIETDFNLKKMNKQQFFENFLNENDQFIKRLAMNNQHYFSANNPQMINGNNGLLWLGDGDQAITLDNAQMGKINKPVIMIVDCTNQVFTSRGEIIIYGLLYVRGDWHPSGQITIYGSVIVEGRILATEDADLVTTSIHYDPSILKPEHPLPATMARVIGSWRDY